MSHPSRIPLPETINLPLMMAAVTSVGIHTMLWFYQPVLPMSDKSAAINARRNVRVVQLRPDEILRLPEYAQQTQQPTLPSLPQVQTPPTLLPNLPQAKSEVTLPAPPSFPIYNPAAPQVTPEPQIRSSRRRPQTTVPASPNQRSTKRKTAKNQSSRSPQSQTQTKNDPLTIDQLSLLESQTKGKPETPQSPPTTQSQQSSQTSGGDFSRVFEQHRSQQNSTPQNSTPQNSLPQTQDTTSSSSQTRPGENLPNITDPMRLPPGSATGANSNKKPAQSDEKKSQSRSSNNGTESPTTTNNNQLEGEANVKAVYGYNATGTTIAEGIQSYRLWLGRQIDRYLDNLNAKRPPIPDSIPSPFKVKLPDVTLAGIAVLVNPEGKIVGEPKLTLSTGYKQLNDLAIEKVKKISFDKTGKYEIYQYMIEINQKDLPPATRTSG